MKKVWLCLLLAVLLLLSGCAAKGPEEEHLIRVGFSQVGSESDWRIANTASMVAHRQHGLDGRGFKRSQRL